MLTLEVSMLAESTPAPTTLGHAWPQEGERWAPPAAPRSGDDTDPEPPRRPNEWWDVDQAEEEQKPLEFSFVTVVAVGATRIYGTADTGHRLAIDARAMRETWRRL